MAEDRTPSSDDAYAVGDTLEIPSQFLKALANDASANDAFDRLAPGDQRAFVDWVAAARDADGREQRAGEALARLKTGRGPDGR